MLDTDERRELVLERSDFRAHDETLAVADTRDRRQNGVAKRRVLRLQVQQRNRRATRSEVGASHSFARR